MGYRIIDSNWIGVGVICATIESNNNHVLMALAWFAYAIALLASMIIRRQHER